MNDIIKDTLEGDKGREDKSILENINKELTKNPDVFVNKINENMIGNLIDYFSKNPDQLQSFTSKIESTLNNTNLDEDSKEDLNNLKYILNSKDKKFDANGLYLKNKVNKELIKVKNYYKNLYSDPLTKAKFKNKKNISKVLDFIPKIKTVIYKNEKESPSSKPFGWVNRNKPTTINLNTWRLNEGNKLNDTISHEAAHLIDFQMQKLHEDTIKTNTHGYYDAVDGQDDYVSSETETFARVQRLRQILNLDPNSNGADIMKSFIREINNKNLTFENLKISKTSDNKFLIFQKNKGEKGLLSDLRIFFSVAKYKDTIIPDISALFANFSTIKNDKVYTNIDLIGKINVATKSIAIDD